MITKKYSKTKPVCKVTFSLTTEQVGKNADVRVLGTFNDWSWDKGLSMKSKKKTYEATLELPTGSTHEFRYLIDGHNWMNDDAADDYVGTPFFSHNFVIQLDEVEIKKVKAKKETTKVKKTSTKKATTTPKVAVATKPDNLTKIEGIGPKIAEHLNNGGIATFEALSKAPLDKLQAILDAAGPRYRIHNPGTWAQQAELAYTGKWDELKALQIELKGGRVVK